MSLTFITPIALLLLALLPLLWALAWVSPQREARWRFWAVLLTRSVLLCALVFALAGAQLVRSTNELTTVFLVDASDSFAPLQRERAVAYINQALSEMRSPNQAAVIVFGENALVERAPGVLSSLNQLHSVPTATRTNIQEAIQLGLALLPSDREKRIILLSDGGENSGQAIEAARLAQVRGVPIDVVTLLGERGQDVILSALTAPAVAREGQDIALNVRINSSIATTGRLQTIVDGQLAGEQQLDIAQGETNITLQLPAGEAGFRRIELRLEAQGDSVGQNNRAATFTEVQGPPRMLVIASQPERANNLVEALEAVGVRVDLRTPNQAPIDLIQLGSYAGVVLVDTPARELPRAMFEVIPTYVQQLGRGFAMVGGTESFGAGGYRRTTIAQVLPVELDPLDTSLQPDVGLVMVIDRSGSMEDVSGTSGRTKLDLAKEAVYQASLGLNLNDQIGLVVFDTAASWIMKLQTMPPAIEIERALSSFGVGGGTDIRPGVELAAQSLSEASAKIKHVILLTDGIANSNYEDLVSEMRANGVTISTVAIGDDANPNLESIAQIGGGRFYRVQRLEEVPKIFLQETVLIVGRDIIEGPFTPQIGLPSSAIRGLGGLPPLMGYNGTEMKETARNLLVTPDGKPLLAQWQYGLGRVVAWTSDFKGQWARDWIAWNNFPRFVNGFVDLMLPPQGDDQLVLQASNTDVQSVIELSAQDAQGRPLNELTLNGRLVDPESNDIPLSFQQIGSGHYRATAQTAQPGVYLAQVAASQNDQQIGLVTTGLVVSYSPEYSLQPENPQLLAALATMTNGRLEPEPQTAFAPTNQAVGVVSEISLPLLWLALLLLPLDIALRRLRIRPSEWKINLPRPVLAPAAPSKPVQNETMSRLSMAKQRASTRTDSASPPKTTEAPTAPSAPAETATRTPPAPQNAPAATSEEERYARLLAAKQRARRRRENPPE
jgi:Mg-chelatase subunit ChlD